MSAIYKTLSKDSTKKSSSSENGEANGTTTYKNRQRVLVISSRGVTFRHRHLINDLSNMMPHGRKEPKFDTKSKLYQLNEIAELYNCNNIMYFEARKHTDLYLWLSKAPNGPSCKFHIQNIHTMDELNFTGNCLKGSRPILSFDSTFDETPHNRLVKELFLHTFGVPPKARKSKPFIDHVVTLSIVDNKIWFRNYQISENAATNANDERKNKGETELSLVEIGPRFVMTLITILEGSFGGPVIYENKEFVSPNFVRAQLRSQQAAAAKSRAEAALNNRIKRREAVLAADPLSNTVLFKQ
ncbi:Brx1p [Sugiyamaella lignohabitans]|uniref:Brx1p n=1 Tax=Sugiyamaella lignohabitans TaxID=796027 RepID=A0A167DLY3_9ASCO|nr:Brx1p [Sugiyamaella lignohabitans]ANB13055.1 Brx1p [Sugiyamaella lignohabitans]